MPTRRPIRSTRRRPSAWVSSRRRRVRSPGGWSASPSTPRGPRDRRFTYAVPERLDDLQPGEAVLVDFGRRQALGIVLGPAERPARRRRAQADRRSGSAPTVRSCRR